MWRWPGDAAFTNGISFEALNNIAAQTKRLIIVLNDNEWSIDKNVGAIAEYFHKIATNPTLQQPARSRRRIWWRSSAARRRGTWRARRMKQPRGWLGVALIFEEFGLSYFGPIDGHNLPLLIETFKFSEAAE